MKIRNSSILYTILTAVIAAGFLTPNGTATTTPVQDMRGVWNGFIQAGINPPEPVRTEITSQANRRFFGTTSPPEPVQPTTIEGTVSASGKVNYQGQSADGHTVGKTDLLDFGGGGAILNGSLTQFSNDGTFIVPCILELRAFFIGSPDPVRTVGRYIGSLSGDGATGQIDMVLQNPPPTHPTSFNGGIQIVLNGQSHNFTLIGTVNGERRVIAIAHAAGAGHMILDAVLVTPPDPVQPPTLNGNFKVEFGDGSELEGTFQTQQSH